MRCSIVTLATLSLALAAPVRRDVVTDVVDATPENQEVQISSVTGSCSTEACQLAQEVGPHNVHDFEQHLAGTQTGLITHGAAYTVDGVTYGNDGGLSDQIESDGQYADAHYGGYPTCPDGTANRNGCSSKRQLVDYESDGQLGGAVKPVLTGQAAAGKAVGDGTQQAGSEGPGAAVSGPGQVVEGFTKEADDYLSFVTGDAFDYEINEGNYAATNPLGQSDRHN